MTRRVFEWVGWTFEPAEWRLSAATGDPVPLPNRTLALLAVLLERAPSLVNKDEILSLVWSGSVVEEGNIAFHIASLRKTLDGTGDAGSCIETVRGRGYRFVAPVTVRDIATSVPLVPTGPAALPKPSGDVVETATPHESPPTRPIAVPNPRRIPLFPVVAAIGLGVIIAGTGWYALSNHAPVIRSVTVMPSLDGLADAVVTTVSRDTTLEARVGSLAAPDEEAVEAGRRLNAEAILTTRVDQTVQPWRVLAQLTRTGDERVIWSWAFDVPADSIATTNATIARQIGFGLGRHFGATRAKAVDGSPTANPVAYDLWLQAREQWRQRTPHAIQQAITLYERAIAIDPAFARAYAGLADCYNLTMSGLPSTERHARALEYAEKAIALDPDDAAGHTSLAFLRYKFEWKWQEADAGFMHALALDPDYALGHHWYGEFLGLMGRYDDAIAHLRRAIELEPQSLAIQSDLIPPLLRAGRVAEARAVVEAAAAINPNWHFVPYRMTDVLFAEGREREAVESQWRWMLLTGSSLDTVDTLRAAYSTGGMAAMLRVEIERYLAIERAAPGAWMNATFLARAYARLGDRAEALRWNNVALDRREDAAISMLTVPDYDSLRDEPEFHRQLARVGLTPLQRR
jgi:DNA-binding winged helix-turn-helix (wHTH) protein/tetratricopeptide (TPR) repeat protein